MGEGKKTKNYKRARTSSQKAERRTAILKAAESHLREAGFEGFSMNVLAKRVGIARGTLYLYFETREEVLLTLYAEQVTGWSEMLLETTSPGIDDETFLREFIEAFKHDPLFFLLLSRLGDVIEHNVSLERLIESKRFLNGIVFQLTSHFSQCLKLELDQTTDLLLSLLVILTGVSQMDNGPHIDPKLLPEDLQAMAEITGDDIYMKSGRLILSGIRAKTQEDNAS